MIIYPAIDLKDGAVVRLKQGRMDDADVFSESPGDQAAAWGAKGFAWLHVVDLDGAFAGQARNGAAIEEIIAAFPGRVQLGGGIRTAEAVTYWLGRGVTRVVLGTAALRNPELVRQVAAARPGQVAIGIDVRDGRVAVEGWAEQTDMAATELVQRFHDAQVAAVIVTDINRDGLNQGANAELCAEMAAAAPIPVIASGGVSSPADIDALMAIRTPPLNGAIIGRAFYDGTLSPTDVLERVANPSASG